MARIVFRCRASVPIGGGHVVRCMALADQFTAAGWRCAFAVDAATVNTVGALARSGFECVDADDRRRADIVVVDDYALDSRFESRTRQWATTVVALDDLADRPHDCDVLVDQTLGRRAGDYKPLVPAACRVLAGSAYALIRAEFRARRNAALQRRVGRVERVLIAPGQTDEYNLATTALRAVRRVLPDVGVDVILGPTAPYLGALLAAANAQTRVHVDLGAAEIADLMRDADLAIGAGGGSSWERCLLGLPTLLVITAENQAKVAESLAAAGAVRVAGRAQTLAATELATQIEALVFDTPALSSMAAKAAEICDGRGALRASVGMIAPVIAPDGSPIWLRAAELSDGELMHDWQRHPDSRRYARNPAVPSWSEHRAWLERKLADAGCLFSVVERAGRAAGLLRLDHTKRGYEISILTAPDARGRGVASAALRLGRALVPGHDLIADVMPANEASQGLFESAGYVRRPDGWFQSSGLRH